MDKLTKSPRLNYLLRQMDIWSFYDVINHLPRRYENFNLTNPNDIRDKERIVIYGQVISYPKQARGRRVISVAFDFMSVDKKYYHVIAYNRGYLSSTIELNEYYTLVGTFNKLKNEISLINLQKGKIEKENTLRPIYSLPKDYPNHLFYGLVKRSLEAVKGKVFSLVPFCYRKKYKLVEKETALNYAHSPRSFEDIRQSLRYLKYEEALMFSLKNQLIKEENKSLAKIKKEPIDLELCKPWLDSLPFKLTDDQKQASEEIIDDMNQSSLMYRMLQGDVGSGKTLVSFIALYANHLRGDQGALMAPTDSLARQHFENAKKAFEGTKLKIALLVGSTPKHEKDLIYDDLRDGNIDIVIGTHALFSKGVEYSSLGLVVIDEQHRFGVNQRIALASKGEHADILSMSATPIPRSLALTLYGDLDISTLTTFPSKKKDIRTSIVESEDEKIFEYVDKSLKDNRQVYIVAPLIEYREDHRYSVEQLFARYVLKYGNKVGLLHGKMSANEKNEALEKFYNNETPILVTTQVIEVGIDVPRANLMVIYDATNFGLASLHQLRGRIGRDGATAYCLLTHDEDEESERLNILVDSFDGFKIAEEDMKMRGPGELAGIKQSGIPNFAFLNIVNDFKIFLVARDDATYILKNKDDKSFKYIIERASKEIKEEDKIKG